MALKAVVGEDGADLPLEIDGLGCSRFLSERRRRSPEEENGHGYPPKNAHRYITRWIRIHDARRFFH
jgi:hypothetical protein